MQKIAHHRALSKTSFRKDSVKSWIAPGGPSDSKQFFAMPCKKKQSACPCGLLADEIRKNHPKIWSGLK